LIGELPKLVCCTNLDAVEARGLRRFQYGLERPIGGEDCKYAELDALYSLLMVDESTNCLVVLRKLTLREN
jgi:hypothetical protein